MRKIFYIVLMLVPFMLTGAASYAMPPHPDLLKKWRDEGTYVENMNRIISSRAISRSAETALKAAPTTGTVRIPVILVAYREEYLAENPTAGFVIRPGGRNILLLLIPAFMMSLLYLFIVRMNAVNKLKPVIPLYAVAVSLLLSCGEKAATGYEERDFPTESVVYDNLLNSTTGLSVRRYYYEMSANGLTLQFDIYGPVTVSKVWSYYGDSDSSVHDKHPGELAAESIKLMLSRNSGTDFSVYDNDNDDIVDTVIIIHEGPGEEYPTSPADTIWSHQWDLYSAQSSGDGTGPVYTDGVWFNSYVEVPEYTAVRGDSSVGVFAHEFGHVLGLPDLYDTLQTTNGVGDWSLMSSGSWGSDGSGNDPAPLLAWERYKAGGSNWVTITALSTTQNDRAISNIESSREVYRIMLDSTPGEEQFLLLEGKTGASGSSWYVPGLVNGILITHIHEGVIDAYLTENTVNAGSSRIHGVNIVEADGGNDLWDISITGNSGTGSDLYTTGESIINALRYNDTTNYTLSTVSTTDDITDIKTGITPMTFDYSP